MALGYNQLTVDQYDNLTVDQYDTMVIDFVDTREDATCVFVPRGAKHLTMLVRISIFEDEGEENV